MKNSRLKIYIYNNTTPTIRSRGNTIDIIDRNFSEDYNSVKVNVKGSSRNRYIIHFHGLQSGEISSTCTCPFDWGTVCKHQVAVANEIDEYVDIKNVKKTVKKIEEVKYSGSDAIRVPFSAQKDCTLDWIKLHTTERVINQAYVSYEYKIKNEKLEVDFFEFLVTNTRRNFRNSILIHKKEGTLSLQCDCNATNQYLCMHQVLVLNHIFDHMPQAFLSEQETREIKSRELREYGFSIEDEIYKEYFNFEYYNKKLVAVPIHQGTLKLNQYQQGLDGIVEDLITGEIAKNDEIPSGLVADQNQKEKGIAIGFHFNKNSERMPLFIIPMEGNLKKDRSELTTKITEITPETLIFNKDRYAGETYDLLQELLQESYEAVSSRIGISDLDTAKHSIARLRRIIPDFKDAILYELKYYSKSRDRKISKHHLNHIKRMEVESASLSFKVKEEKLHYIFKSYITIAEVTYDLAKVKMEYKFPFVIKDGVYYLNESIGSSRSIKTFKDNPELRIPKTEFESYYNRFIQPLSTKFPVEINHLNKEMKTIPAKKLRKQLFLSEINGFILLKPMVDYEGTLVEILNDSYVDELSDGKIIRLKRNEEYETEFRETLKGLHPGFLLQRQSFFHLSPKEFIKDGWFLDAFDMLKKEDVQIFGYEKLSDMKYSHHKPSFSIQIKSDIDWFDAHIKVAFGDTEVSLKEIQKSVINKSKYVELSDGSIGILPEEWIQKYSHLFRVGEVKKDGIRLSKYQLSVIDSLYDELNEDIPILQKHREIKKQLSSFQEISKVAKPKGIKTTLRDYQKEGLNWLNFLDEYNFGGCLADDMGLGKTLQVITFFKHLKEKKKPKNAHLVVVPTSLIFNWQEEVRKFCPSLKVFVLTGGDRKKDIAAFKNTDIVLTTYGIVMRDIEYLKKYTFNYIVLDESQAIKNPSSQRFKAIKLLKSDNKLVLTGTPIENNTFDLYAQMTFANPGLLGNMSHFKKMFSIPIDKNKDKNIAQELKQLIDPFLLRRTKEQVATELPEKTEQVLYCTMEESQQKLYDAYRNKYRNFVLNKIDEGGVGKSKMYVLEGLTKLRQICDAPQLLNGDEEYTADAIKIKELLRHVTEKTGAHKVLIFSQFVKMLDLIKTALRTEGIQYEYLDGKTKNRQEKVENFQNNDQIRVFLISLKAGGTGLNLTAADYVYLVDPWWNPAVEAQAIDRCYRIGQTKNVMAYKMICKGTIEEKIITHQQNKKQLSNDIIQTDESFVKSLSKESIAELFS